MNEHLLWIFVTYQLSADSLYEQTSPRLPCITWHYRQRGALQWAEPTISVHGIVKDVDLALDLHCKQEPKCETVHIHSPWVNYTVCIKLYKVRSEITMENSRAKILLTLYICTTNLVFYHLSYARDFGGVWSNKATGLQIPILHSGV